MRMATARKENFISRCQLTCFRYSVNRTGENICYQNTHTDNINSFFHLFFCPLLLLSLQSIPDAVFLFFALPYTFTHFSSLADFSTASKTFWHSTPSLKLGEGILFSSIAFKKSYTTCTKVCS